MSDYVKRAGGVGDQYLSALAESQEQTKLIGAPNQVEAVMANMQKREPSFAD